MSHSKIKGINLQFLNVNQMIQKNDTLNGSGISVLSTHLIADLLKNLHARMTKSYPILFGLINSARMPS